MKKIVIAEAFVHFIPTGLGFAEGLSELGCEVYALSTVTNRISDLDQEVDCLIHLGWPDENDVISLKTKYPNIKIVIVGFGWNDLCMRLKNYVHLWIEHTWKHELADELFKEHNLTLHHIPLGASTSRFKPLNIDNKHYDLSFVGQFGNSGHGYRHQDFYLTPLMDINLKGFYSGFNNYPPIRHEDLNLIYNQTKININFHYWHQKEQSTDPQTCIDFNGRVFEIALAGGFQLCDHPHIQEYFGDGIIYASKEDWKDVFLYYLHNEQERNKITEKAIKNAVAKHTWKCRMEQLINLL